MKRFSRLCAGITAFALVCAPAAFLEAETPSANIVQIEEDWELWVAVPDPDSAGPQVTCVAAPFGDQESIAAALELNHRSMWTFRPGGMQLQFWDGEYLHQVREHSDLSLLSTAQEQIKWTTRMSIADGQVKIEVLNGSSTTWGAFGAAGSLMVARATQWGHLDEYSVDRSVKNSGVAYGGNRVVVLRINAVRKTRTDGTVEVDQQERVVHKAD